MERHLRIHVSLELSSLCVLDAAGKIIRAPQIRSGSNPMLLAKSDGEVSMNQTGEVGPPGWYEWHATDPLDEV